MIDFVLLGNQFSLREYFMSNDKSFQWFNLSDEEKTKEKLEEIFGESFTKLMVHISNNTLSNGLCYNCSKESNLVMQGIKCDTCAYSFCDEHRESHECINEPIKYKMLYSIFRMNGEFCPVDDDDAIKISKLNLPIKVYGDYVFNEQKAVDRHSHFTFNHDAVGYIIKRLRPDYDNVTFLLKNIMRSFNMELIKSIAEKNFRSPNPEISGAQLFITTYVKSQFNKYSTTWFKICMIEAISKLPVDKIEFEF